MKDDSASYFESQEFAELLHNYEEMISEGNSVYFDSSDLVNLAEYYSINGEPDKSDAVIEYGLNLHPCNSDILISKAGLLLMRGQNAEARVISESINDIDNQELAYLRGELEFTDGKIDLAEHWFNIALNMSDNDPGMLNDIIVKYMDGRRYDLCQKWLDRALIISPDSRNFIELQADLYFDTGQTEAAIEWYNHLLDEFAYDTYYWEQLGRIWYEREDYTQAMECFEYIEAIDPEYKPARMMEASCRLQMEQWEEAYLIYKELLEDDPSSSTLLYYCGRCLFELEDYENALPYLLKTYEEMDEEATRDMYVELYLLLASSAYRLGNKEDALAWLNEGLDLDPNDTELLNLAAKLISGNKNDISEKSENNINDL